MSHIQWREETIDEEKLSWAANRGDSGELASGRFPSFLFLRLASFPILTSSAYNRRLAAPCLEPMAGRALQPVGAVPLREHRKPKRRSVVGEIGTKRSAPAIFFRAIWLRMHILF
jgi:hypothetical protein